MIFFFLRLKWIIIYQDKSSKSQREKNESFIPVIFLAAENKCKALLILILNTIFRDAFQAHLLFAQVWVLYFF